MWPADIAQMYRVSFLTSFSLLLDCDHNLWYLGYWVLMYGALNSGQFPFFSDQVWSSDILLISNAFKDMYSEPRIGRTVMTGKLCGHNSIMMMLMSNRCHLNLSIILFLAWHTYLILHSRQYILFLLWQLSKCYVIMVSDMMLPSSSCARYSATVLTGIRSVA